MMTRLPRHIVRRAALAARALPVVCAMTLGPPSAAEAKSAEAPPTLRVMLNPATASRGTLPDTARDRLTALAGAPVTLVGTTRTGALELAVAGPRRAGPFDISGWISEFLG